MHEAADSAAHYRDVALEQQQRIGGLDAETRYLGDILEKVEKQDEVIRRLVGAPEASSVSSTTSATSSDASGTRKQMRSVGFQAIRARVEQLRDQSLAMQRENQELRTQALHVLNLRNLEELANSRLIAAIPSITPVKGATISAGFGWRTSPWPEFHQGVDLAVDYGTPVHAGAAGVVVFAGWDGGYGKRIEIDHGNGYHTWYCHLSEIDVHPGQYVTKTRMIGAVGSTGASTGPHLHYQLMFNGRPIDPVPFLNGVPANILAQLK
jgi:murein DD-endopeptidase MepM/ murein hydrolase activator NlpD